MGAWCNALSLTVRAWLPYKRGTPISSARSVPMNGAGNAKGTGTQLQGKLLPFGIANFAFNHTAFRSLTLPFCVTARLPFDAIIVPFSL